MDFWPIQQAWISAPLKLIPNLDWPLETSGYRTPWWWKGDLGASPFEGWVSYSTLINSKFYFLAWDWWFAITFIAFGLYPRHGTHDSNCSSRSILEHIESHEIMLCFVSQKPFHTSLISKWQFPHLVDEFDRKSQKTCWNWSWWSQKANNKKQLIQTRCIFGHWGKPLSLNCSGFYTGFPTAGWNPTTEFWCVDSLNKPSGRSYIPFPNHLV